MVKSEKRHMVLQSALNIFAEKGFVETTISEIAGNAGIRDSVLYGLFDGKEDILFSIPMEYSSASNASLVEHLRGMKGAEPKLRKFLWHYLNFQEKNKKYATILLFELRGNRRFYRSEAYNWFKKYNQILIGILKEGIDEGVFQRTTNIYQCRNVIFGAFDHIIYGWLLFNKPKNVAQQADDLFDLIFAAIRADSKDSATAARKSQGIDWAFDKKAMILQISEAIFANKGYDKTRISDISKALGIGDATIYEYFKSKEDVLFNIPFERSNYLIDSLEEQLSRKRDAEMKLRRFIWHYLTFLQENKDYVAILLFELRANKNFYGSTAYQALRKCNDILMEILKLGKEEGSFRKEANVHLCRDMIFGGIDHSALTWLLFGKPPALLDEVEGLTRIFLKALAA